MSYVAEDAAVQAPAPATDVATEPRPSPELRLLELIDRSDVYGPNDGCTLRQLQRACMHVPHLSQLLTGNRRLKLYRQLLLNDVGHLTKGTASYAARADQATSEERIQAAKLLSIFPPGGLSTVEAAGFMQYCSEKNGFPYSDHHAAVFLALATVVANAELPTISESLHLLSALMSAAQDFLVSDSNRLYDKVTCRLLSLLLQYHDPRLSVHCDHHKVDIGIVAANWSRQLFVLQEKYADALPILDWLFILGDPVLVPYVAIAYLISIRQRLLDVGSSDLQAQLSTLVMTLPTSKAEALNPKLVDGRSIALVPVWLGKSLLQNADLTYRNTPLSTQRVLEFCLNPESGSFKNTPEELEEYYSSWPCLPLERADISASFSVSSHQHTEGPPLEYVILDCRSQASYDYARLPTSIFLGDVVNFDQDKLDKLEGRVQGCNGSHLALFGTGRRFVEEVNLLKLVALQLVQKAYPYVSFVTGGFRTIIPLIRAHTIRMVIQSRGKPQPAGLSLLDSASSGFANVLMGLSGIKDEAGIEVRKLKEKAKEGFSSAGTWGWSLLQSAQQKMEDARASTPAEVRMTPSSATQQPRGQKQQPVLQGYVAPAPQQAFTLEDEDDSEDFGLITVIPPRPLRGTLVSSCTATSAGALAPTTAAADAPPEVAAGEESPEAVPPASTTGADDITASIDAEFEALFNGLPSTAKGNAGQSKVLAEPVATDATMDDLFDL